MARRVRWSEPALQDLEGAADFIARDSTFYARALVRLAFAASRSLARFPDRGRVVPEFGDDGVREIFVQRYRLIYEVHTETVEILALVHGARDLGSPAGSDESA
mgnify:CR=1 FL=1